MNNRRFIENIVESASDYPFYTFTKKGLIYTCVNPFSYHLVRKNQDLYMKMDGLYVDGMLMCKVINLLWHIHVPRLSFDMSGMAVDLFNRLNNNNESIFFLGARQDALEKTVGVIKASYPNIHISGFRNGYFQSDEERNSVISDIVNLNPDFVIVGMGSPLQEEFAIDLKDNGYKGITFTCGGFLHQTVNGINYYPDWINKYNLRAFYRLYKEKGLFKRLYNVLIEFPILFAWDTLVTKLSINNYPYGRRVNHRSPIEIIHTVYERQRAHERQTQPSAKEVIN